jgi:hypothetical protein
VITLNYLQGIISKANMKTSRETLGTLMAQMSKMQTYQDAIEAMLNQSVILPPELLAEIQSFIEENKHLGFTTRERSLYATRQDGA